MDSKAVDPASSPVTKEEKLGSQTKEKELQREEAQFHTSAHAPNQQSQAAAGYGDGDDLRNKRNTTPSLTDVSETDQAKGQPAASLDDQRTTECQQKERTKSTEKNSELPLEAANEGQPKELDGTEEGENSTAAKVNSEQIGWDGSEQTVGLSDENENFYLDRGKQICCVVSKHDAKIRKAIKFGKDYKKGQFEGRFLKVDSKLYDIKINKNSLSFREVVCENKDYYIAGSEKHGPYIVSKHSSQSCHLTEFKGANTFKFVDSSVEVDGKLFHVIEEQGQLFLKPDSDSESEESDNDDSSTPTKQDHKEKPEQSNNQGDKQADNGEQQSDVVPSSSTTTEDTIGISDNKGEQDPSLKVGGSESGNLNFSQFLNILFFGLKHIKNFNLHAFIQHQTMTVITVLSLFHE